MKSVRWFKFPNWIIFLNFFLIHFFNLFLMQCSIWLSSTHLQKRKKGICYWKLSAGTGMKLFYFILFFLLNSVVVLYQQVMCSAIKWFVFGEHYGDFIIIQNFRSDIEGYRVRSPFKCWINRTIVQEIQIFKYNSRQTDIIIIIIMNYYLKVWDVGGENVFCLRSIVFFFLLQQQECGILFSTTKGNGLSAIRTAKQRNK